MLNKRDVMITGRFAAIYYVNVQHMNAEQVGVLEGTMPIVRLMAQPIWGMISDKTRRRKYTALLTSLCGNALLMLFAFPHSITNSFDRVLMVTLAVSAFNSSGILDAYALDILGPKRSLDYGRIRLFAAIAWGMLSLTHTHSYAHTKMLSSNRI